MADAQTVGIRVDIIKSLDDIVSAVSNALIKKQVWLMTFVNPASTIVAARNHNLRNILMRFDVVAPDGIGMVLAIKWLHRQKSLRVSFDSTSLAPHIFQMAEEHGKTIAFIGGHPGVADLAKTRLQSAYPKIKIDGVFDGFNQSAVIEKIMELNPAIVIVGMGCLVQERFLLGLVDAGWKGVGFTCGGFFDQLAKKGTDYYPAWIDRLELRWAYRLMMEPRRLWRRYLIEYPEFGLRLMKNLVTKN
ncbi:unnamed protein product [Sphagnum tenellum]